MSNEETWTLHGSPSFQQARSLIGALRSHLFTMSDEDRLMVFASVMANYCPHCGTKILPCHCQNDD